MVDDNILQNIIFDQTFFSWSIVGRMSQFELKKNPAYKESCETFIIPLSANPTKWSNTLKQFAGNLPTNCFSVFYHFLGLTLKELWNLVYENS